MNTDMTAVRSSDDVTRAMSANRAALTPEPRPGVAQQHEHAMHALPLAISKIPFNRM